MKNILVITAIIFIVLTIFSFGNNTSDIGVKKLPLKNKASHKIIESNKKLAQTKIENQTQKKLIAKGKKLFASKTCIVCHRIDSKLVGPSLRKIATTYKSKNVNILNFLKGKSSAIVEPSMSGIMHPYVESTLKKMSEDNLNALVAYIESSIK